MATKTLWKGVAIAVQSVLAATKTITAVTKASPAVASSTAHGYANGDYVLLTINGMTQLDGRVVRVANQAANTFECEGVDSTSYDTFTSGTAQLITFGTNLATAVGVNASGGDYDFEDTTTIHDSIRSQVPKLPAPSVFSFESIWDPADAGLIALKTAADAQAKRAFRFTFSNGYKYLFNGYVGCSLQPTGQALGLVKTSVIITAEGRPTAYST